MLMKNIRVASPCPTSWESMAGDDRVRYCSLCNLNVYNFAELTRNEVRELLLRSEGRVCGRLYRRTDGTILTRDCPTGLRALRRRVSRIASATAAALFSFASFAFGGTMCEMKKHGHIKLDIERSAAPQKAMLTGVVLAAGNPLPGATVKVRSETGIAELTTVSDATGAFTVASIDDGLYRVEVTLAGFNPAAIEHLQLDGNEVTKAQFSMQLAEMQTVGIIAVDPQLRNEPLTTTFTQDFINKLPIR